MPHSSSNIRTIAMSVTETAFILILLFLNKRKVKQTKKKHLRKYRVQPFNIERITNGMYNTHYKRLRFFPIKFAKCCRMSIQTFDELLSVIKEDLTRKANKTGDGICAEERLVITLRYLATGMTFTDLAFDFMLGTTTVNHIVRKTCQVICNKLHQVEMPTPTESIWSQKAADFYAKTQFPNCIGAIDGKHIRLKNPRKSGSLFYNYKKFFSIVLLAVADANYCFTSIDVGAYGREGDSQIFKRSNFGKRLTNNTLCLPDIKALPSGTADRVPHVFVGDEAFGLHLNLMRPYPSSNLNREKKVFNYRLSRARRFVECTFGILSNKWRVFENAILVQPDFASDIVKAACVLHNFVRKRDGYKYSHTLSHSMTDSSPRLDLARNVGAHSIRDKFSEYYSSLEGRLQWQNRFI